MTLSLQSSEEKTAKTIYFIFKKLCVINYCHLLIWHCIIYYLTLCYFYFPFYLSSLLILSYLNLLRLHDSFSGCICFVFLWQRSSRGTKSRFAVPTFAAQRKPQFVSEEKINRQHSWDENFNQQSKDLEVCFLYEDKLFWWQKFSKRQKFLFSSCW